MKGVNGINALKSINYFSLICIIGCFLGSFLDKSIFNIVTIAIVIFAGALIFFIKKVYLTDYNSFFNEAKNGVIILGIIFFITLLRRDFSGKFDLLAPYIIIYFISCVIILRLLRQERNSTASKTIKRLNFVYSFSVLGVAIAFGFESVRSFLLKIIVGLWHLIPDFIYKLLYWIIYGIAYVLSVPIEFLLNLLRNRKLDLKNPSTINGNKPLVKDFKSKIDYIFSSDLFKVILWILIISLIIYVLYRMFSKKTSARHRDQEFEEEKEFILNDGVAAPTFLKRLSDLTKIRNNNEKIRFYYQKLLTLCKKKEIDILQSDTSLEINKKSRLDVKQMGYIRSIYIRVRYGEYIATNEDYQEFMMNFRLLEKENRRN